jgi:hypothetical protein
VLTPIILSGWDITAESSEAWFNSPIVASLLTHSKGLRPGPAKVRRAAHLSECPVRFCVPSHLSRFSLTSKWRIPRHLLERLSGGSSTIIL